MRRRSFWAVITFSYNTPGRPVNWSGFNTPHKTSFVECAHQGWMLQEYITKCNTAFYCALRVHNNALNVNCINCSRRCDESNIRCFSIQFAIWLISKAMNAAPYERASRCNSTRCHWLLQINYLCFGDVMWQIWKGDCKEKFQ